VAPDDPVAQQLRSALVWHFRVSARQGYPFLGDLMSCIHDFLREAQAIVRLASGVQHEINAHLGRSAPHRPLAVADLCLHNRTQGGGDQVVPGLIAELEEMLGVRITVEKDRLEISGRA
jgi:hypothetical protein